MASGSDQLGELYDGWLRILNSNPDMSLQDMRALFEHWGDVTDEPADVDYAIVDIDGTKAMWVMPKGCSTEHVLLCAHGGGYALCSMYSHRKLFAHFAKAAGCRALIVDYRRAPEFRHPSQLNEMLEVYRWLVDREKIDPGNIGLIGDSAGGALVLSMIIRILELGWPRPAAAIPLAPFIDLAGTAASIETNAEHDRLGSRESVETFANFVLEDGESRTDPLISPLYADFKGFPPLMIQVGGYDIILDDSVRLHERALAAGVDATLIVGPGMQHVYQFMAGTAEIADAAIAKAAVWLRPRFKSPISRVAV